MNAGTTRKMINLYTTVLKPFLKEQYISFYLEGGNALSGSVLALLAGVDSSSSLPES